MVSGYIGRFAPSPTGPLHAGSLVAALASWLDARAHQGVWLVRIEDVDTTRSLPGMDRVILQQLAACGLHSDRPPVYQSRRSPRYQQALLELVQRTWAYPCACSRQDIERALAQAGHSRPRHAELIYPGTCRDGLHGKLPRAWRFRVTVYKKEPPLTPIHQAQDAIESEAFNQATGLEKKTYFSVNLHWTDRRLGAQSQDVVRQVGDFILRRADGCFAYQLAVVVDDAAQGITDVVRGEDLADNTARQIVLQHALSLPTPRYLHTPLVLSPEGEKLSKQNGAQAFDTQHPLLALNQAAARLGLSQQADPVEALPHWVREWQDLWKIQQMS
jgi:glutamyl-Q tRNA(Asp) synthetase